MPKKNFEYGDLEVSTDAREKLKRRESQPDRIVRSVIDVTDEVAAMLKERIVAGEVQPGDLYVFDRWIDEDGAHACIRKPTYPPDFTSTDEVLSEPFEITEHHIKLVMSESD